MGAIGGAIGVKLGGRWELATMGGELYPMGGVPIYHMERQSRNEV